jgi:4-aminobutyrate aminotransferase-like enzyme
VVLGKPLGNGHPLGAVVTTAEIAASFANGMEFFSTFGGSTLSCMVGREVLTIVDEEGLQANAEAMGDEMLAGLRALQQRHPIIGDVRGMGLFLGVELVRDRETLEPATEVASTIANRLRDHRILIGTEGPHDNILKIRPPLTFGHGDAEMLLDRLDRILGEDACRAG